MITQSEKQCSLSRAASINRKARKKQNPVINTLLNFVSLIALAAMVPGASAATAPVNTVPPVVSGTWAVGGTLTTTDGTWTGTPTITFTYQWQRCIHADGGTVINIPGATQSSYTVVNSDVHNFIRVVITGHNSAGSGTGISITTRVGTATPMVSTVAATPISATSATLNGVVSAEGASTKVWFTVGKAPALNTGNEKTVPADQSPVAGTAVDAAVSATITELTPNTTYYFAVFGANNWTPSGSGGMLGSILSFTTGPATDTYYYSFTGADTFTVPAGVTSIHVVATGGGGGGGGGGSDPGGPGGNGGSGAVVTADMLVTPSQTLSLYVGGGGGGGDAGSGSGEGGGGGGACSTMIEAGQSDQIIAGGGDGGDLVGLCGRSNGDGDRCGGGLFERQCRIVS